MTQIFRADNFSAGPAGLPLAVLEKAQAELLNWQNMGTSVMEISHRSPEFIALAETAEANLRELMAIPENYKVLFLQGGARLQFSAVPLNLFGKNAKANYIDTGAWSNGAIEEAKRYGTVHLAGSLIDSADEIRVPNQNELNIDETASYLHYCPNETISGVAFDYVPNTDIPVVADMSSCILSEQIDVSKFGLIYAGAQKNIGPAGLTLVIVRDDLLNQALPHCPSIMNYHNQATKDSMLNTPPTYSWYLAGLVFEWLKEQGGVAAIQAINQQKADLLYDYIDSSDFYQNNIAKTSRSKMNVSFSLVNNQADDALNEAFLTQAKARNLLFLKGHRSVGGMRASIYNAVSLESVQRLLEFMEVFKNNQ